MSKDKDVSEGEITLAVYVLGAAAVTAYAFAMHLSEYWALFGVLVFLLVSVIFTTAIRWLNGTGEQVPPLHPNTHRGIAAATALLLVVGHALGQGLI